MVNIKESYNKDVTSNSYIENVDLKPDNLNVFTNKILYREDSG